MGEGRKPLGKQYLTGTQYRLRKQARTVPTATPPGDGSPGIPGLLFRRCIMAMKQIARPALNSQARPGLVVAFPVQD
jgi:hypothetical protein